MCGGGDLAAMLIGCEGVRVRDPDDLLFFC